MKNTEPVTIFCRSGDEWQKALYMASIHFVNSSVSENGGVVSDRYVKIRIPSDTALDIKIGDRLCLGDAENFTYEESFFISEICENIKGKNRHIRLVCR